MCVAFRMLIFVSARTNKRHHHHHHTSLTDRGQLSSHACASNKIHFSSTLLANAHSGKDSSVSLRARRESQRRGDGGGACTLALRTSSLLSTFASSVCDVVCTRLLSLLHKCSGLGHVHECKQDCWHRWPTLEALSPWRCRSISE